MSILNVSITPACARVSVDTLADAAAGGNAVAQAVGAEVKRQGIQTNKLQCLVHLPAVYATRGDALAGNVAFMGLCTAPAQTFDDAAQCMPGVLAAAYAQAMEIRRMQTGIVASQGLEVVLVGWSESQQRMVGWQWVRYPHERAFRQTLIDGALYSPGARWDVQPSPPITDDDFVSIAHDELAYITAEHPDMRAGGRLLLAELVRGQLVVRKIADLDGRHALDPHGGI